MIRAIQFQNKRVGSTFLQNAIDSHPDIVGIDEVFVNMAKKAGMRKSGFVPYLRSTINNPSEYIKNVVYKKYPDKNTIFKLMYNQIEYHNGLMHFIMGNKIPMIHVMRKNLVKQVISGMNAATTKHNPIAVTGKNLLEAVKVADELNKKWSIDLKGYIKITLYYEDIIGKTVDDRTYMSNNANIAVCNFFKVNQVQLFAKTKKKNKEDLTVYLSNINEIKKTFKGGKFQWMLEE